MALGADERKRAACTLPFCAWSRAGAQLENPLEKSRLGRIRELPGTCRADATAAHDVGRIGSARVAVGTAKCERPVRALPFRPRIGVSAQVCHLRQESHSRGDGIFPGTGAADASTCPNPARVRRTRVAFGANEIKAENQLPSTLLLGRAWRRVHRHVRGIGPLPRPDPSPAQVRHAPPPAMTYAGRGAQRCLLAQMRSKGESTPLHTAPGAGLAPSSSTRARNRALAAAGSFPAQVRQTPCPATTLTGQRTAGMALGADQVERLVGPLPGCAGRRGGTQLGDPD